MADSSDINEADDLSDFDMGFEEGVKYFVLKIFNLITRENSDDLSDFEPDEDMDEELKLPPNLRNIGKKEKKELLQYKRTHNEVIIFVALFELWLKCYHCCQREWEDELVRRDDLVGRKIDLERLRRKINQESNVVEAATAAPSKRTKPTKVSHNLLGQTQNSRDEFSYIRLSRRQKHLPSDEWLKMMMKRERYLRRTRTTI